MRGHSHLTVSRSQDGVSNWEIDPEPTMLPDLENYPEELWDIEDPRITYVPELEQYAILYTSYSRGGPGVSMAPTKDFRRFERLGVLMPSKDHDVCALRAQQDGRGTANVGCPPSNQDRFIRNRLEVIIE